MHTRFLTASLVLAACGGGSTLDPGSGPDPGSGTSTLFVDGRVTAEPRLSNARTNAEFDAELSIRVLLGQAPVTTGTVTITSASGTFALAYNTEENRWTGRANGYDEVYILDIESGPDEVHDVRVDGPDIHFFEAPLAGATVDSTLPLAIEWNRGDEAESASIETKRLDRVSIPDSGDYMLSAGALEADREQAKENDIELERTYRVVPAGAVAGSELSVRVRNAIRVIAQPNPAL